MASGPVSRTNRPNTWLLRPALQRALSLDSLEPSTHDPKRLFTELVMLEFDRHPVVGSERRTGKSTISRDQIGHWQQSASSRGCRTLCHIDPRGLLGFDCAIA
jgi:hypothetical protein